MKNLQNVLIIRIQMNGKVRILIILMIIIFSSCNRYNQLLFTGKNQKYIYNYYYNDSINVAVKLAGDNELVRKKVPLGKLVKKHKLDSEKEHIIDVFQTSNEPIFNVFAFYFKDSSELNVFFENQISYNSSINFTENQIEIVDTSRLVYGRGKSNLKNEYILFVAFTSNFDRQEFELMRHEYSENLGSIIFNYDYKNILPNPFQLAFDNDKSLDGSFNYLRPIQILQEFESFYGKYDPIYNQAIQTYSSMISNHPNNQKTIDYFQKTRPIENDTIATNERVIEKISQLIKDQRLVIFNESHFDNRNRELFRFLLKEFKKEGFTHLGFEALSLGYEKVLDRNFLTSKDGFYTNNPILSNLIRESIQLGFNVFAYDSIKGNREINQANNIYNKTIKRDSNARIILFTGEDHLLKQKDDYNKHWMAYYLKELYNIEALTFSQTIISPPERKWLSLSDGKVQSYKNVDYVIGNNITNENINELETYSINLEFPSSKYTHTYLLSIYIDYEYKVRKDAVPVKNYIINNKCGKLYVKLPKGVYFYTVKFTNGDVYLKGNVE